MESLISIPSLPLTEQTMAVTGNAFTASCTSDKAFNVCTFATDSNRVLTFSSEPYDVNHIQNGSYNASVSHRNDLPSYADSTTTPEGCQLLTYNSSLSDFPTSSEPWRHVRCRNPLASLYYKHDNIQDSNLFKDTTESGKPSSRTSCCFSQTTSQISSISDCHTKQQLKGNQILAFSSNKNGAEGNGHSYLPQTPTKHSHNTSLFLQHAPEAENITKKTKRVRRHIPHALRPKEFVERRNCRERRRIGHVNQAFEVLRHHIPSLGGNERASKIAILQHACNYIRDLTCHLRESVTS